MSNSTPPGWYPDPEFGPSGGAARERYWDGGAWTAQYRPAAPPVDAPPAQVWPGTGPGPLAHSALSDASPAYGHPAVPESAEPPGYGFPQGFPAPARYPAPPVPPAYPPPGQYGPPYAPQPPTPQPAPKRRAGLLVGVLSGALLLVAGAVGATLLTRHGPATATAGAPAHAAPPAAGDPAPSATPSGAPSGRPTGDPSGQPAPVAPDGSLQDVRHGWSVPLLSGWTNTAHDPGLTVSMVTGPYTCAMPGGCVRGNFAIGAGPVAGADAKTVAEQAMERSAPQLFGELTSHHELVSGQLTVAGATGYAVRWYVEPVSGAKGYLLEVAVPVDGGFALITGSVDDDPGAPGPATLDEIVSFIHAGAPGSV